jgi:hypothetical protein
MKPYLLLILLSLCQIAFSQEANFEKPNYKKIGKEIKSKGSGYFYPNLMQRYQNSDSTLNIEEKRHLYYGYTFQPEYLPYGKSAYNDSLKAILSNPELDSAGYDAVLKYSDSLLNHNPFDVRALNNKLNVYDYRKNDSEAIKYMIRLNIIFDAILSSGDGTTKETAFYVIAVSHEYDVLHIIGFNFGGQQSLVEHYDYLTVKKNQYGIDGFYFDISPCLKHLHDFYK